jgi:hypothetical protein
MKTRTNPRTITACLWCEARRIKVGGITVVPHEPWCQHAADRDDVEYLPNQRVF